MKKQEMIDTIIAEEKRLWNDLKRCSDILEKDDPLTDLAVARWVCVNNLIEKLQIK
jgi:hypothetical protein